MTTLPCIAVLRNLKTTPNSKLTITSRDIRKRNLTSLKKSLNSSDWYSNDRLDKDVNSKMKTFHDMLTKQIEYHCPITTRTVKFSQVRREPWLSAGMLNSIKKCKSLYKQTLLPNCCNKVLEKYKNYNRVLQRLKRVSKTTHYETLCIKHKANTKQLWRVINGVISVTNDKTNIISCLKIDNIKTYNPMQIAEGFGEYFANVGKTFANRIQKPQQDISKYLDKIERNPKSMFARPTDALEVKRLISQLPNKTSSGFDNISNILLKEIYPPLIDRLVELINESMITGIFPEVMKEAEVVPLFKSKSPLEVGNYRPISLLLTVSKILEKIIYSRTYSFLNETNQLFVSQYGFRAKHSCDHAISELLGEIVKNYQLGKYTLGIFLDLSKAFDTLEHSVIFAKLEKYGIRGPILEWFKSYLSERTLAVKCSTKNNVPIKSSKYNVNYGTPQGSCLGPLIFLIFCNDLQLNLTFLSCIQFADDTSLYKGHYNLQYLKFCAEHDMQSLQDWFRANKLTLNIQKSVCILFSPNNRIIQFKLELDGLSIPQVRCTKLLGLWVDDQLRWNDHVNKLILKLKCKIHLLKRGKNFLTPQAKRILYHAQIQSNLSYGLVCWGNMIDEISINRIRKIQNACVRLIDPNKSLERNYADYKILTIHQLIWIENAKIWWKFHKGLLPTKLGENMKLDQFKKSLMKTHKYATRRKAELNIPKAQHKKYRNSFLINGLKDYQSLPSDIKNSEKLGQLVNLCKHRLFKKI